MFYGTKEITKTLIKSDYDRDRTFLSIYNWLEDKKEMLKERYDKSEK